MIRSGVTCFADMYYFEEAIAEATAAAGMRALCAQTVLRFPAPDASSYEESLALARDFIQRWRGHPLIVPAPAPHAPYTCTPEILRACAELAVEFDVPLHIHLSERRRSGRLRRLHGARSCRGPEHGLFDAKVLAAHCVHWTRRDPALKTRMRACRKSVEHLSSAPVWRRSPACWSSA